MDGLNHWRLFLNSGSVLDYLDYKRAQESESRQRETEREENPHEIPDRRLDHPRTEYR